MTEHLQGRQARHDENDLPPGAAGDDENTAPRAMVISYCIGLALSALLTGASFYALSSRFIWGPAIPVALIMLAIAQIGVHLVFFLHITTAPDNTNNILALAFGILIVALIVAGSLWIMTHLNHNMLPMEQIMRMQR